MLMSTEFIVYLWLLPVTVFILIPFFLFIGWMIVSCIRWFVSSNSFITEKSSENPSEDELQPSEV